MKVIFCVVLMAAGMAMAQTGPADHGGGTVGSDDGYNVQVKVQFLSADGQPVPSAAARLDVSQLRYGFYTPQDAPPIPQLGWHLGPQGEGAEPTQLFLSDANGVVVINKKVGTQGVNVKFGFFGIYDTVCAASQAGHLYKFSYASVYPVTCVDQNGRVVEDENGNIGVIETGVKFDGISPTSPDPSVKVSMVCHFQETLSQLPIKIQAWRADYCK